MDDKKNTKNKTSQENPYMFKLIQAIVAVVDTVCKMYMITMMIIECTKVNKTQEQQ